MPWGVIYSGWGKKPPPYRGKFIKAGLRSKDE